MKFWLIINLNVAYYMNFQGILYQMMSGSIKIKYDIEIELTMTKLILNMNSEKSERKKIMKEFNKKCELMKK